MAQDKEIGRKYFHCYATANDARLHIMDLMNLKRMKHTVSGVDKIYLIIAISEVQKPGKFDQLFIRKVKTMFQNHANIELIDIFYKTNIGRDFSSYHLMFQKVKPLANSNDYILFHNRSGYGPFHKNWYKKFTEQFEKFNSVAICGSTINFMDHPSRSTRNDLPHVQTYTFLSKIGLMQMLNDQFPCTTEMDRCKIITEGEIGLSQFFLEKGYKITCIEWPTNAFSNHSQAPVNMDPKKQVVAQHCFLHRKYFKRTKIINLKKLGQDIKTIIA